MRHLEALLGVFLLCGITGCGNNKNNKKTATEFKYDGKGYMVRELISASENGKRVNYKARRDMIYNEKGLLLYDLNYDFIIENGGYTIYTKDVYEYNSSDQLIRKTYYELDDNDELTPRGKSEYTYTSNNMTLEEYSIYNTDHFFTTRRDEKTYDANNNLLTHTTYTNGSGTMKFNHRIEYSYNSSNQLIKEEHFQPGYGDNNPEDFKLISTNYSYDSNGNLILEEYEDYKDIYLKHKNEYEYNSNNKVVKKLNYRGGEDGSANYVLIEKYEYTYDEANNLKVYKEEELDDDKVNFILHKKDTYTYNESNKLINKEEETHINGVKEIMFISYTRNYEYITYE